MQAGHVGNCNAQVYSVLIFSPSDVSNVSYISSLMLRSHHLRKKRWDISKMFHLYIIFLDTENMHKLIDLGEEAKRGIDFKVDIENG